MRTLVSRVAAELVPARRCAATALGAAEADASRAWGLGRQETRGSQCSEAPAHHPLSWDSVLCPLLLRTCPACAPGISVLLPPLCLVAELLGAVAGLAPSQLCLQGPSTSQHADVTGLCSPPSDQVCAWPGTTPCQGPRGTLVSDLAEVIERLPCGQ